MLCGVVLMPRAPLHANVDQWQPDCRPWVWSRKVMPGRISRAWPSPANKRYGRRYGSESSGARAVRMSAVAKSICEPVIDRCQKTSFVCEMSKCVARDEPRRTTAMKKHNHSSDDRPIQYRGTYSRHSRVKR